MIKIFGLAVVGAVTFILLKKYSPEFTVLFETGAAIFVFLFVYPHLCELIDVVKTYGEGSGISSEYINIIIKALGISIVTQFSSDMCKDAGETAIASKVELAGRVLIISLSIPIISTLLETMIKLLLSRKNEYSTEDCREVLEKAKKGVYRFAHPLPYSSAFTCYLRRFGCFSCSRYCGKG